MFKVKPIPLVITHMVFGYMLEGNQRQFGSSQRRLMTEIELSIGLILGAPVWPADIPKCPRPLWAGFWSCPPAVDIDRDEYERHPGRYHPSFRRPYRRSNRDWMEQISRQLGRPDCGDDGILLAGNNGVPGPGLDEELMREIEAKDFHGLLIGRNQQVH